LQSASANNASVYSKVNSVSATWGTTNKAVSTIGDGINTTYAFKHNLNTQDVITQVYNTSTFTVGIPTIVNTSTSTVTLTFNSPPSLNSYRVVVIG